MEIGRVESEQPTPPQQLGNKLVIHLSAFGTGSILFMVTAIAVALVMVLVVKAISGKEFKVTPTSFILVLLVPLALGTGILAVGSFLEVHEAPGLCGEYCHAMEPLYVSYNNPGNNTMLSDHSSRGVTCLDCHTGPGWGGQIDVWMDVPHEAYYEVMGKYEPGDLGGHVSPLWCTKCHDGDYAPLPLHITTAINTTLDIHVEGSFCGDCHNAHDGGIGYTEEACTVCHGTEIEDFLISLDNHGARSGGECMDCHDRAHPSDAQIPFADYPELIDSKFCSDCHIGEFQALNGSATPLAKELYGECTSCHEDHEPSVPIHDMVAPFDDCAQCHLGMDKLGGIHNRTKISYIEMDGIENDFCKACHSPEVGRLSRSAIHGDLDCVSCHDDHGLRVVFDDCIDCHGDELPEWHVPETIGCNWDYCHGTNFYH